MNRTKGPSISVTSLLLGMGIGVPCGMGEMNGILDY